MFCFWTTVGLLCFGPIQRNSATIIPNTDLRTGNNIQLYDDGPESNGLMSSGDETLVKRSAFGLLGLATNRPHKTEADLMHPPPARAFLSNRGRKRSSRFLFAQGVGGARIEDDTDPPFLATITHQTTL